MTSDPVAEALRECEEAVADVQACSNDCYTCSRCGEAIMVAISRYGEACREAAQQCGCCTTGRASTCPDCSVEAIAAARAEGEKAGYERGVLDGRSKQFTEQFRLLPGEK